MSASASGFGFRIAVAAVAVASLAGLSGCGDDDAPQRAGTVASSKDTETSEPAPENSEAPPPVGPAGGPGRELSAAEVTQILPTVGDMPTGWSVDPDNSLGGDDEDDSVVTPASCDELFNGLDEMTEDPAAKADVTFMAGALGPFLGVSVSSMSEIIPDDAMKQITDAFGSCSDFELDDGKEVASVTASPLSFPNLGEESIAIRFNAESPSVTLAIDYVGIRSGHNLVVVSQAGVGGAADIAPLEQAAKVVMNNLAK